MSCVRQEKQTICLTAATIVHAVNASDTVKYAASELNKFLFSLSGKSGFITDSAPKNGTVVILSIEKTQKASSIQHLKPFGDQSFQIETFADNNNSGVLISAKTSRGVLYGVYRFLEELGMGFYAGGET